MLSLDIVALLRGAVEGATGGKLSPEMLEKRRAAGREAGPRGAAWGRLGGRKQNECKSSSEKPAISCGF